MVNYKTGGSMKSKISLRIGVPTALFTLMLATVLALPTAAAEQDAKPTISITSVDLNAGTVDITNHGDADVDPNGLVLCNFPAYAPIEGAPVIAPGETITVDSGAHGVGLDAAAGEMGIYTVSEFENPDAMITYVEWGEGGHTRAPVAISAGVWADGFVEPADGVISASVPNPTSPDDWAASAGDAAEEPETTELATTGTNTTAVLLIVAGALLIAGLMALNASRRPEFG